jgi:2'-5' RNA ligase
MRLFVAIELPDGARARLADLAQRLAPVTESVGWVAPEAYHLTLKFLGEVADEARKEVEAACAAAAAAVKGPFEVRLCGAGAYPSLRRPRVIWAGVDAPEALARLAAAVEEELEPLGFPREKRPWTAHVTLGRVRAPHARRRPRPGRKAPPDDGAALGAAIAALAEFDGGTVPVREVSLMRSELRRTGAIYTPIGRYPLAGA